MNVAALKEFSSVLLSAPREKPVCACSQLISWRKTKMSSFITLLKLSIIMLHKKTLEQIMFDPSIINI